MPEHDVGLRISLKDRREAAQGLAEVERGVDKVGDAAETAGRKAEEAGRRWDRFRSILGTVGRGVAYGVSILGALGAAATGAGLKIVASMEQSRIAFTTMLGSAVKARRFLGQLQTFAAKTPFEFPELQTAASSLVSVGINANKVIPIMTTLGDVTSGMGTGSEGIKRATVALQQMNAAQRITGEDLNQLRDAGIPVYDLLAAALGKTKGEVVALAQQGKLGKDSLDAMMHALETGQGLERFNGLMEQQSQSLSGLWSTMLDTVSMGLKRIFTPVRPLAKDVLRYLTEVATGAIPRLRAGVKSTVEAIRSLVQAYKQGGLKGVLDAIRGGAGDGAGQLAEAFGAIGAAVAGIDWSKFGDAAIQGTTDTLSVFAVVIGFAADHVDTLAKAMPYLVTAFVAYKAAQGAANTIALASLPLKAAEITATFTHSAALRAHSVALAGSTVATEANTAAENVGILTRARAVVGIVAQKAAAIAVSAATKIWTAGQWLLNAALTANPIGLVVVGISALVAGIVLAYKNSETFRGIIDKLWNGALKPFGEFIGKVLVGYLKMLATYWLMMGRFGVKAFTWLLTAAFATFDGILSAAEKGLGWVPGLGDKIKGAREAFDQFGDATITKLKALSDKLLDVQNKINGVAKDRSATITITTVRRQAAESTVSGYGPQMRARGGPVTRGLPYIVGEHRPELFVPEVNGRIVPQVPRMPLLDGSSTLVAPDVHDLAALSAVDTGDLAGLTARRPLHVHVEVDGREIAEAVLDDFDDRAARR